MAIYLNGQNAGLINRIVRQENESLRDLFVKMFVAVSSIPKRVTFATLRARFTPKIQTHTENGRRNFKTTTTKEPRRLSRHGSDPVRSAAVITNPM